jgi:hypothetical protein
VLLKYSTKHKKLERRWKVPKIVCEFSFELPEGLSIEPTHEQIVEWLQFALGETYCLKSPLESLEIGELENVCVKNVFYD